MTIKGIDTADGVTIWEYGPGTLWRDHYGMDQITGIEVASGASLDRVVYHSFGHLGGTNPIPARGGGLPVPNASECLRFTSLDSLDGSVISSGVTIDGLFCTQVTDNGFLTTHNVRATAALSGGDYLMVGDELPPGIEFVDYSTNTANKEYIFHCHALRAGDVTITTRTSSETVTIPYNVSAASLKTLLEATADVVSATCTGGPWPLRKISVDITWSASGGDIASITHDQTYTVGFGEDRSTSGSAWVYDPATGLLESAIGYEFGRGLSKTEARLFTTGGLLPAPATEALLRAGNGCGSADGNRAFFCAGDSIECWTVGSTWTADWLKVTSDVSGTSGPTPSWWRAEDDAIVGGLIRKTFTGPTRIRCGFSIAASTGTVTEIDYPDTVGADDGNRVYVRAQDGTPATTGAFNYYANYSDTNFPNLTFRHHVPGGEMEIDGDKFHLGGTAFSSVCGFDAAQIYGMYTSTSPQINYGPALTTGANIAGSIAKSWFWWFYTGLHQHFETGTEFRFRFGGSGAALPTLYSDWVDWLATDSEIETAILNGIGENTEGVVSSCVVYPFGGHPYSIVNATGSLERGLQIRFAGAASTAATAFGFQLGSAYFRNGRVTIETRTPTLSGTAGLAAWDRTTGALVWSRPFGTAPGTGSTIIGAECWVKSGILYAVNGPAEAELP